ncbi:MAG: flippase-like domain-containing protein [bacterium]|nr:flippase-like domain-containing protein [bacterium]
MNDRIKRGVVLFLVFTVIAYAAIIFIYLRGFPKNAEMNFRWDFILGAFFLFAVSTLFNILRVFFLGRIFSKSFTFSDSASFTLGGVLLALITPFQAGGMPFQLYIMSKRGISPGEGTSVLVSRGVQSVFVFAATIPFTMFFFSNLLSGGMVENLIKYFLVLYSILFLTVGIILAFTSRIKSGVSEGRMNEKIKKAVLKILDEVQNFRRGMQIMITKGLRESILSLLCAFISLYGSFSLTYFIVMMANGKNDFFLSFNMQFLLTYLSAFVPTPGSSGVAEGGIALFYSQVIPKSATLPFIFIQRLVTTYIPALMGLLLMFGKKSILKEIK